MYDPRIAYPTSRRGFLGDLGMGFTGLVLGSMFHRDGIARAQGSPGVIALDYVPRAKNVIWLFMVGGASHMEGFDPKPELTRHAGKTIEESPHKEILKAKFADNVRVVLEEQANGKTRKTIYPMQVGFRKRGQAGIEVSDWWPEVGSCVDDIAFVRSMWTTDNDHGAQLQFHTGRHVLEGKLPTIGSWIHYGLGSMNDDLPSFVVLGTPIADCCGGVGGHGPGYLGPEHDGVRLEVDSKNPLPFALPSHGVLPEEQRANFALINKLNRMSASKYPEDPALRARIKSYELAYRMQTSVPEVVKVEQETAETQALYGLDRDASKTFGSQCLAARRMVEQGVRFVQIFHGSNGGAGAWDAHDNLKQNHHDLCTQVDRPIAGLLKDLKRRGLLDETIVVWASEFGRTPGAQNAAGRDHHPFGFTVWMAGGGIKGGVVHGATDELGYHAVIDRHYVTDIHATVLRQLGLDAHKLEIPGHKRLEMDFGKPIEAILS